MKITRIRLTQYRLPFVRPYVTAAGRATHREGILVRLDTDSGLTGVGESALLPHDFKSFDHLVADTQAASRAAVGQDLQEIALGQTSFSNTELLPQAIAGIDIAAWDALARSRSEPLCGLLNKTALEYVPVNALVTEENSAKAAVAAARAVEDGFATVKLKVGVAASLSAEIARIVAVREAIGSGIRLRLDANGAWSEVEAREVLSALEPYAIEYLEQPIAPGQVGVLQRLMTESPVPIAADEDVVDLEAARRLIEERAVHLLIVKPVSLGGIGPTLGILQAAGGAGIGCIVTTGVESGVGTAAALHIAAALNSGAASGLATAGLLQSDLLLSPLQIEAGDMQVPAGRGLGIELDGKAVATYRISESIYSRVTMSS